MRAKVHLFGGWHTLATVPLDRLVYRPPSVGHGKTLLHTKPHTCPTDRACWCRGLPVVLPLPDWTEVPSLVIRRSRQAHSRFVIESENGTPYSLPMTLDEALATMGEVLS